MVRLVASNIVTAVLVSAFWIVAYNLTGGQSTEIGTPAERQRPGTDGQAAAPRGVVVGPSGLAVPVTNIGAFRTNSINTPGWFGRRPAIKPCRPKFCSEGPSPPRGHSTSGKV